MSATRVKWRWLGIKFFEHPLSPYAQKVKLALIEKSIPFEVAMPDLLSGGDALASMSGFDMLPQLVEACVFVREYRDHRLEWMLRSGGASTSSSRA